MINPESTYDSNYKIYLNKAVESSTGKTYVEMYFKMYYYGSALIQYVTIQDNLASINTLGKWSIQAANEPAAGSTELTTTFIRATT